MTEKTPLPSFEEDIRAEMSTPAASTEFVLDLKSRLEARLAPSPQNQSAGSPSSHRERDEESTASVSSSPRLRVPVSPRPFFLRPMLAAPALVLLILLITLLAVGPQRVLAAVRGLFGYIPGVGVVQEGSSLRILAETASLEREGITLQVQEGAADAARTILVYQVDGLSVAAANSQGEAARTGGIAVLALPDGTILTQTGMEMRGWGTGYQARLVFPPLPPDVNGFTLVIERLDTMPAGAAPEDWRIPLAFKPAPADLAMLPVYELTPPPAPEAEIQSVLPMEVSTDEEPAPFGVHIAFDRAVETEQGFLIQGHTDWQGQPYSSVSFDAWFAENVKLVDGQGNLIPFEPTDPDYSAWPASANTGTASLWALQTNSKAYPGPWTLSVTGMDVYQAVTDPAATFNLDFGASPQPGQTWALDQTVQVAGFTLRAVSAALRLDERMGNPVLDVLVEADPAMTGFGLEDPLNQPKEGQTAGAGGGPQELETDQQLTMIPYYEMPSGQHTLQITSVSYALAGTWQISWTPPAVADTAAPQPEQACLTAEAWRQSVEQPAALPAGLSGRLLVEQYTGQLMPQMVLVNLDGSSRQDLAIGGWSSLSPDGSTAAYIESDGPSLMLFDVASGQSRPVSGSTPEDYHAVWSADGQWLAFVRSNDGIYISRPDGSGRRQVVDASRIRFLVGWLPDSRRLVLTSLGPDGSQAQVVDVESGEIQDLFNIDQVKGGFMMLSPDGSRVAYSELTFGTSYYSIYTANLDGSDKRLAAALDGGVTSGAWSPDGQWLAVSVSSYVDGIEVQTAAILQTDTCQVIPLPGVEGNIVSWVNRP